MTATEDANKALVIEPPKDSAWLSGRGLLSSTVPWEHGIMSPFTGPIDGFLV